MASKVTRAKPRRAEARLRDDAKALFRNAILDAAEEVFAASGFHAARVQDVARHARLAVGTIYNHFGQKEDVLTALLEARMLAIVEKLAPAPDDPSAFPEKLVVRIERLLAFIEQHRDFFTVATDLGLLGDTSGSAQHILGGRALPHVVPFSRALRDLVDEGVKAGALEPFDRELLAAFLKNSVRSVGRWSRDQGSKMPTREAARAIVALFFDGARRKPKRLPVKAIYQR